MLGTGLLLGTTSAQSMGCDYDEFDAPGTVLTRRTVVEQQAVTPPGQIVREVVMERH